MNNLVAAGIFMLLLLAGIGIMMAGIGIYTWGKRESRKNEKE
jgi:hypothetical protein